MLAQPISGWMFDSFGGQTLLIAGAVITAFCVFLIFIKRKILLP